MSALSYIIIKISGCLINYIFAGTRKDPHSQKHSRQNSVLSDVIALVTKQMGQYIGEGVKRGFDESQ